MLKIENIKLAFAERVLFDGIQVFIGENDKIGLVGKNGAGKSTLLKIILGAVKPNEGSVIKPKEFTLGYLPQDLDFVSTLGVYDEVMTAFEEVRSLEKELDRLTGELERRTDYESSGYMDLAEDLNKVAVQLGMHDINTQAEEVERVLLGLGFERSDFEKPLNTFSGGWKMRVALAKILLKKPDLILLDEPTNHLDMESVQWLEKYLKNQTGAVLLISHDRTFLDQVTNRTLELVNGKAYDYPMPYTRFIEQRKEVIQRQLDAKKNQEKEIKQTEQLINKFRAKSSKASFAQSLIKKLDKMDIVEVDDEESSNFGFRFRPAPRSGKVVVKGDDLGKYYDDKRIFEHVNFEIARGERVALVGKNGAGKTTLTKVIAGLTPYKGECELGYNVDIGYYSQNQSEELPVDMTVHDVIDNEATGEYRKQVRSLLGAFMFSGDDVFKKVKVLSGGERARLALCKLLLHEYNFIVLDEPTNHLDMRAKDVLKQALQQFDGTLLIVSHDRDFLKGLTESVMEIKNGDMTVFPGDISEFLEMKQAESIRDFEYEQKKVKSQAAKQKGGNEKEKWQLSKKISGLERDIEKLETDLEDLRSKGGDIDPSDAEALKKYQEKLTWLESKLSKKMEEWETAEESMNILEG
ncbi:MAG: ABC-F family ATP-binding cassette domain-containing protein [Cryomorphaceae bacterium]|nr:ABC-F family ATP-binding cassette domain-containing protein [Flavobacteriales bacterium]